MSFLQNILQNQSVSIVGMEKNTGKTECMNYIIRSLENKGKVIAVTSIGIDGEGLDQVTNTHKPEIELMENMIFVTSEKHYREKKLTSEILNISEQQTSLGRLVTAQVKQRGKVIISGPTTTLWLKQMISEMPSYGADITLVDGALSRKSLGSPSVTQSMILTTGAALSPNLSELVRKTKFVFHLINIEQFIHPLSSQMIAIENGIWAIDDTDGLHDLEIPSTLLLEKYKDRLFRFGMTLFVSGIITDKILDLLRLQKNIKNTVLIVKDFTKIFVSPESLNAFLKKGGKIKVLLKTKLMAVCVNPTSPEGYVLDSNKLRDSLSETLGVPVYDVFQMNE
ncbi:MAG: hypothetical protein PHR53_05360 [Bacteroidales bacterium]|nr:hypothetical protein [Bacteroidales bacterium]